MEITWQVENWQLSPSWDPRVPPRIPIRFTRHEGLRILGQGGFRNRAAAQNQCFFLHLGQTAILPRETVDSGMQLQQRSGIDSEMITEVSRIYEENPGILVNIKKSGKLAFIPPKLQCNRHTHLNMIDI